MVTTAGAGSHPTSPAPRCRHTAATVLLVLGVSQRAVMGLMGWSNNSMTTRYQHLTPDLRRDIARPVDELLG